MPDLTDLLNKVHNMDCFDLLRCIPDGSVDAVITDPIYAEVGRDYGRITEADWHALMQRCVIEFRRVLKPSGSAMLVIQPNSASVGTMRLWVWEFLVWCGRNWNIVQDAYWWNIAALPTVHTHRDKGLMRPSLKYCVWLGSPNCYRNQDTVLWGLSDSTKAADLTERALVHHPSGHTLRRGRINSAAHERGGSTPFNVLPIANADSANSAGANGHSAGTPHELAAWWVRYICPIDGIVLDPFSGSGTISIAARMSGRRFIAGDQSADYCTIARDRLRMPFEPREHVKEAPPLSDLPLFAATGD